MITVSLSPNTQIDDYIRTLIITFSPWQWKNGKQINQVENWFKDYLSTPYIKSFNSGRSAFYALLKSFDITAGDEVIIQPFTCLAVPEVILWVGATPIYVDIDNSLNIDPRKLEKAITPKTRAIVVQHTFGIPANIKSIKKIVQKHNIILIEDCAHSLGAMTNRRKIGTIGDAAFFSFGRDKVISSVFGGLAAINKPAKKAVSNMEKLYDELDYPNYFWIFQQLLHPLAFALILPIYEIGLGKALLIFLQKLKLLSFPIYNEEKIGQKPTIFPKRYPNGLAFLLLNQLTKIDKYITHRMNVAKLYFNKLKKRPDIQLPPENSESIYLRFNILTRKAKIIRDNAKGKGILLGNWYHAVIDPEGSSKVAQYKNGQCTLAESYAKMSLNLPTHIKIHAKDIDKIVSLI